MQLEGLPQEGEERMRVDQICDISVGGLGGGGGFVNDFFPEAATNTTSSGDFFPSVSISIISCDVFIFLHLPCVKKCHSIPIFIYFIVHSC